jgi:hypothetical protein
MNEKEGRQTVEAIVLLDRLYFAFTEITKIIADNLRLDKLVQAILQISLVFDLNSEDIKVFNSLFFVVAFLAVDDIHQLSFEIIIDEIVLVGIFKSVLEAIEKLVEKFICVMLFLDIDG